MQSGRTDVWEKSDEVYSESQIESILNVLEIDIVSQTHTHFLCYCPFHDNDSSPAFAIDMEKGLWTCFNPSCDQRGNLEGLVRKIKKCNIFQAQMLIIKHRSVVVTKKKVVNPKEFPSFDQNKLDELYRNFKGSSAQTYMYGRGFEDSTLEYFRVGYSPEKTYPKYRPEMVTVPMHDIKGNPIGLIGRSIIGKQFKNSTGLPKKYTIWNVHRARKASSTLIVVEASFDGMRVHQTGYPNVGGLLGGHLSPWHIEQIDRNFDAVIIMTDFESGEDLFTPPNCRKCYPKTCRGHRPGRDLGHQIASHLDKKIRWATYDDTCVYPNNAKDVSQMTDEQIGQCLENSISNYEYNRWKIEEQGLLW